MKLFAVAIAALLGLAAQDDAKVPDHQFTAPDDMKWVDAPPSLPPGAKVAIIEGNPAKPGPFTMRIKFPAGYKIAPHYHPAIEHVTVLSGSVNLGAGDSLDDSKSKTLGVGGFAVMQTGVKHFLSTKEEAVVQAHSIGPWGITYVNPSDDPRAKK
jgi:quercetin dioxygenase-like cupin family protein